MASDSHPSTGSGHQPPAGPRTVSGGIDHQTLLGRFDGDAEMMAAVLEVFLAEWEDQLTAVRDAVAAVDATALSQSAHRFRGSLGILGPGEALATLEQLETEATDGATGAAQRRFDELEQQVTALVSSLSRIPRATR